MKLAVTLFSLIRRESRTMSDWQPGAAPFPQPTAEQQAFDQWMYETMVRRGQIKELPFVEYHTNIGERPAEND